MGRYEKNRKKKSRKWIWGICLTFLLGFLALFVMPQILYRMNGEQILNDSAVSQDPNEDTLLPGDALYETVNAMEFPAILDEGNIEVESLFQFSGVNPDAEKQDATDVASIILKNTSDKYLSEATVRATLASGMELTFVVREIPAGASVMAFSVENDNLLPTDICTDITAEATFKDVPDNDSVEFFAEGMMVTITNTSSEDLNEIDVYYRDVFDDKYFGGMTYSYKIENLPAGESTTFTAEESLLGVVDVVRVAVNNKN